MIKHHLGNNLLTIMIISISAILPSCISNESQSISSIENDDIEAADAIDLNNFYKYLMISNMYSDALLDIYDTPNMNQLDYLYNYSDDRLKDIIDASKQNSVSHPELSKSNPECSKAISNLYLIPDSTYVTGDVIQVNHKILLNGNVRSNIYINKNEESYNSFSTLKDFAIDCTTGNCKIVDVLDSKGGSTKKLIPELCQ